LLHLVLENTVLRVAPLGGVEPGERLGRPYHAFAVCSWKKAVMDQAAVDALAHIVGLGPWVNVEVRGSAGDRFLQNREEMFCRIGNLRLSFPSEFNGGDNFRARSDRELQLEIAKIVLGSRTRVNCWVSNCDAQKIADLPVGNREPMQSFRFGQFTGGNFVHRHGLNFDDTQGMSFRNEFGELGRWTKPKLFDDAGKTSTRISAVVFDCATHLLMRCPAQRDEFAR
jgi:hypothetical protein